MNYKELKTKYCIFHAQIYNANVRVVEPCKVRLRDHYRHTYFCRIAVVLVYLFHPEECGW